MEVFDLDLVLHRRGPSVQVGGFSCPLSDDGPLGVGQLADGPPLLHQWNQNRLGGSFKSAHPAIVALDFAYATNLEGMRSMDTSLCEFAGCRGRHAMEHLVVRRI